MKVFIATIQTTKQQQLVNICFDSMETLQKYLNDNFEIVLQFTARSIDYITTSDLCNEDKE